MSVGGGGSSDFTYLAVPVRIAAPASIYQPASREPLVLPALPEDALLDDFAAEIPAPNLDAVTQTSASLDNLILRPPSSCDNGLDDKNNPFLPTSASNCLDSIVVTTTTTVASVETASLTEVDLEDEDALDVRG